uniref:Serum response factor homolog n=2 Tax=gambiae species complex TaxID=44542 RepID=A0A8W7Q2L8_ANOCL
MTKISVGGAYELSTLTGTQVMLLVASETGHVYTFATRKLQPMITSEAGKALIQTCLNSPDPPTGSSGDQRMSATGFEETELSYNIGDEDSKVRQLVYGHGHHGHAHLGHPQTGHYGLDQGLMQQPYPGGQGSPLSHAQSYPPHSGHTHHSHIPHHSHTHMTHAHAQR